MYETIKVWVGKRKTKRGTSYHLRYISPKSHKWVSKMVGTDKKRADREAALLEKQLNEGTYNETRRISWDDFAKYQIASIPGNAHRAACRSVLNAFGRRFKPSSPMHVTYTMIEEFVFDMRKRKLSQATINGKLRYLRLSFNNAIKRGYMIKNPMDAWTWERSNVKDPRTVSKVEEVALVDAASNMYGDQWRLLVCLAIGTGGRRSELLRLSWDDIDFDDCSVLFTETKGKCDRRVPVDMALLLELRKLQAKTLVEGGPFVSIKNNINRTWGRIRESAGVANVTIHDLRRTYCTRLVKSGVPLKTVQRLSGHASLETLIKYYNEVTPDDLREAVRKMTAAFG